MKPRNVTGVLHPRSGAGGLRAFLPILVAFSVSSLGLAVLWSAAEAARGGGHMGRAHGAAMRGLGLEVLNMAEELNLTPEQVSRLKAIRKSVPAKIMPKTQALMEARIEYRDVMADANADTKAIRAAHARLLEAQSQLKAASFDLRLEARDVLTAEQRSELKKHVRQRVRERGNRTRSPRMQRQRMGWNGDGPMSFGFLDEPFGDDDVPFPGFDPEGDFQSGWASNPDWNGENFFWFHEDSDESPEAETP